mmetsp:Transcript_70584/g.228622  ORF Transcript_70584/g.228622 Transcript_70584/m.228622 type:complete len:559 (-) Transcript_70584:67-1743(-)
MFEDLDEVCNAIDRLEGKAPLKDLGHKNDIGRNSVPEAPQPEDAVQTCAPSRPTLSLEAALQLQRELYEGFANKDFQAELRELEEQHGKGYEGYGGEAERTALYLTVQSAILPKYGFEGSQAGVVAMLEAASCHNTNEEFRENRRMLNQLLGLEPTGEELSRRVGAAKGKGKGKGEAPEGGAPEGGEGTEGGETVTEGAPGGKKDGGKKPNDDDSSSSSDGGWFDQNGDGEIDLDDIFEAEVEGEAVEDIIRKKGAWPFFIVGQSAIAFLLWTGGAMYRAQNDDGMLFQVKAGLDTFSKGWSDLRIFGSSCEDLRSEVWRYLTYQFSHVGISHVGMNVFMNCILGIPLEALHGNLRMFLMYNIGVFGGAMCYIVGDAHKAVVGMSGGCYSLIGMQCADLFINWKQKKFRKPTVLFLVILASVDIVTYVTALGSDNASHTAHVGGFIAGVLIGILVAKNLVVEGYERVVQAITLVVGLLLLLWVVIWLASMNPPRNIQESYGWCWLRQVWDPTLFPAERWTCVKCGTQECIDRYEALQFVAEVKKSECQGEFFNGDAAR